MFFDYLVWTDFNAVAAVSNGQTFVLFDVVPLVFFFPSTPCPYFLSFTSINTIKLGCR